MVIFNLPHLFDLFTPVSVIFDYQNLQIIKLTVLSSQTKCQSTGEFGGFADVFITQKGLLIITGCSHSGIINIINYAKKLTRVDKVYGVIGEFHLLDKTEAEINMVSNFFKQENIEYLVPCHCCDLKSKIILSQDNDVKELCTGDTIMLQ